MKTDLTDRDAHVHIISIYNSLYKLFQYQKLYFLWDHLTGKYYPLLIYFVVINIVIDLNLYVDPL